MQAIILAAGMGRRLKELTNDNTKCMVKVNGVSLIERMLRQLDEFRLERIVIVVGYKGKELIDYISSLPVKTPVVYVDNPIYDKTNNIYSLYLARNYLMESDTLLLESDLIFDTDALRQLVEDPYPSLALVAKYESWMDGTVVKLEEDNSIRRFIPKKHFRYEDIGSYYKTVNIYKFSRTFSNSHYVPFLEAYIRALGENEYYEQVLRVIALLDKPEIKAEVLREGVSWYEIDDLQDLDIAESIFIEPEEKLHKLGSRYGGYWRYPHLKDFCYLVNPYYPSPQMIAELKANFETVLRMYPSGQRVNALLCAKFFGIPVNYLVAGNGAAELIKALLEESEGTLGIVRPTFEEYPNRYADKIVAYVPQNPDYAYTADDLMTYFDEHPVDMLCLINPDNPSGNYIDKADVVHLAMWAQERGMRLIVDESFVDFAKRDEPQTLLVREILDMFPTMVVVKSLSKSYGIPGLRLGVLASADEALIARLRKVVAIWNINSIAEFYMQISEKYIPEYQEAVANIQRARETFMLALQEIPFLRVIPSCANYFMCELTGGWKAHDVCVALLDRYGILIKELNGKPGIQGEFIRIAVRDDADNRYLVEAMRQLAAQEA